MKTRRFPIALFLLFLLLGLSAPVVHLPAPWGREVLPGVAVLSLVVCLLSRELPSRVWIGGAALISLLALYAWNPTHRWSDGLGLLPVEHISHFPGSASPAGTVNALLLATAMYAAYMLAFRLSEQHVLFLQVAVALVAAALSVVVIGQRLEPNASVVIESTGGFVNENHFAVVMNMSLPLVLALASRSRFRAVEEGRPTSPSGLFWTAAVLMGTAVVMSRSRAGVAVMGVVVVVHLVQAHRWVRRYPFAGVPPSPRTRLFRAGLVLLMGGLVLAAFAREWPQWASIQREWAFRFGILQDVWASWRAHPWWGTGPGSFSDVFPYYQSEAYRGVGILHAHCEPVQFLSEFGVAGGLWAALAAVLVLTAMRRVRGEAERLPPFGELERRAFALGLLACALHGLVDFPLRIPLIALMAAAWTGVWTGHRPARSEAWVKTGEGTMSSPRKEDESA